MSDEYPQFFYKYRFVNNYENLQADYAIDALLKNEAIFSSRRNFNDLFDSKIDLLKPTPQEFKEMKKHVSSADKKFITDCISNGRFTAQGLEVVAGVNDMFNKLIDSYAFLSVSTNPVSNLMWSHYGDSHRGFCIEFKSEFMRADRVSYTRTVPRLKAIDMHRVYFKLDSGESLGHSIWSALRTKLEEWSYESEYRFQAGNAIRRIPKGQKFIKVPYEPEFVESVIFGCRISRDVKKFIIDNMPKGTKFKQAVERISTIELVRI